MLLGFKSSVLLRVQIAIIKIEKTNTEGIPVSITFYPLNYLSPF